MSLFIAILRQAVSSKFESQIPKFRNSLETGNSLDLQRKYSNRIDVLCCIKTTVQSQGDRSERDEESPKPGLPEADPNRSLPEESTLFEQFFRNHFIPFILRKPMKIIILGSVKELRT